MTATEHTIDLTLKQAKELAAKGELVLLVPMEPQPPLWASRREPELVPGTVTRWRWQWTFDAEFNATAPYTPGDVLACREPWIYAPSGEIAYAAKYQTRSEDGWNAAWTMDSSAARLRPTVVECVPERAEGNWLWKVRVRL